MGGGKLLIFKYLCDYIFFLNNYFVIIEKRLFTCYFRSEKSVYTDEKSNFAKKMHRL